MLSWYQLYPRGGGEMKMKSVGRETTYQWTTTETTGGNVEPGTEGSASRLRSELEPSLKRKL